jgi:hypothetical protein
MASIRREGCAGGRGKASVCRGEDWGAGRPGGHGPAGAGRSPILMMPVKAAGMPARRLILQAGGPCP